MSGSGDHNDLELEIDGTLENIRQVFSETMVIEPSMQDVGPVIKIRKIEIDESLYR